VRSNDSSTANMPTVAATPTRNENRSNGDLPYVVPSCVAKSRRQVASRPGPIHRAQRPCARQVARALMARNRV
jgi:hypothetical protein